MEYHRLCASISMRDLITLAIPAFIVLLFVEAIAGAIMRRDIYEIKDAAASITMGLGNVGTYNPVRIAFHEWAHMFRDAWTAPGWPNKLLYIFGNPGWRHDERAGADFSH